MKTIVTIDHNFERVYTQYIKQLSTAMLTNALRKQIKKASNSIAEEIVNNLEITVYFHKELDGTVAISTGVRKKI